MFQKILWTAILLVIVLWIVLSYIPSALLSLPAFRFVGGQTMAYAAIIALVLFLAIQAWLVFVTGRSVRGYTPDEKSAAPARPSLSAEIFWTALPIAMTLALAWAGYAMWQRLLGS